jgi:general transcription factor 3C polypeptide 3 (transcription factor C subunit 4)
MMTLSRSPEDSRVAGSYADQCRNPEDERISTNDDFSDEESPVPTDNGVYAGTRSRNLGRPRLSWAEPRGRGRSRGRGRGGLGRGNKGVKRGPRPAVEPSDEFVALQREAVNVMIDEQDHDKALDIIQKAIAINPEQYAAHTLLAEIYNAKGEHEKSLGALFAGAHAAPREANIWMQVAEKYLQSQSIDHTLALNQASYCYARAVDISQNDREARFRRADINRQLQRYGKAMKDLLKLLEDTPHDSIVLRQIAQVCVESQRVDQAKSLYEKTIAFHKSSGNTPKNAFPWSDINVYVELFGLAEEYEEGIATLKSMSRWLLGRQDESYWDDIVEDDREWDADDEPRREEVADYVPGQYPLESYGDGLPLELRVRLGIYRVHLGREHRHEAFGHFEWLEPDDDEPDAKLFEYSDLFREAGNALKDAKEFEEALRYYEPIKRHNLCSETSFWLAIAASSYVCGKKAQAIHCYEEAKALDQECIEARTQLSKLYKDFSDRDRALENSQEAMRIARKAIVSTGRRKYEKKEQREEREAAERAYKAAKRMPAPKFDQRHSRPVLDFKKAQLQWQLPSASSLIEAGGSTTTPMKKPRVRKQALSVTEQERSRTIHVKSLYSTLQSLTPAMREGEPLAHSTWLDCANELIQDFRSMRVFYPHERHIKFQGYDGEAKQFAFQKKWKKELRAREATEASMLSERDPTAEIDEADIPLPTTESTVPTDYRGIPFEDWLDVFLEHALVLAKMGQDYKVQSYTTINAAIDCVVWFHQPESMVQIYVCYFTCALALEDAPTMTNLAARWFMRQYQFCTDTYRLFSALNLVYKYPVEQGGKETQLQYATWRLGPSQKFVFRQLKAVDGLLPEDYNIGGADGPVPAFMRTNLNKVEKEDAAETERHVTGYPQTIGLVKPREMDVVLLCLYAQILYAGGSFPNALSYYYRAYALDPKNPMVLLSMALSYTHQMFKRQNENRHAYLMQGLAFFEEYAECRVAQVEKAGERDAKQVRVEVEFNRARMWQMLGLGDLAVKGYAKVLELRGGRPTEREDSGGVGEEVETGEMESFTMEAAYAMQTTYALNGDLDSARAITERWMVIE